MSMTVFMVAWAAGYLAGSISFSRLAVRLLKSDLELGNVAAPIKGADSQYRFGSTGATTVSMYHGSKVGCAIALADMLKIVFVVGGFKFLYPDDSYLLAAAVGGMMGHNWPVFHRFKGGRGISAYYGGLFVIDWLGALVTMVSGMFFGMFVVKDIIITYMSGLWFLLPWMWVTGKGGAYILYALAVNLIFLAAMLPDIRAYIAIKDSGELDQQAIMESFPMGRGMIKISEWCRKKFSWRR